MNIIRQTYHINASPEQVWQALTDPVMIQRWSGSPAEFPLQVGAPYSLWDGDIGGRILEMDAPRRLAQTWKPKEWTTKNSSVTFVLTPTRDGTQVDLLHENVEENDQHDTDRGWDIYYLGAIKRMLEARAPQARTATAKSPAKLKTARNKPPVKRKATTKSRTVKKIKAQTRGPAPKKKTVKRK